MPTIQVPATVQAVLAARIDRLPPEEKRLVQTAAVLGTEVPMTVLQAIAELSEEVLQRGLAHLQAAEFLYEARLFPEQAFTFAHALTHEVAYGSLLRERRRVLHARIMEVMESLAGDRVTEQVERLAYHTRTDGARLLCFLAPSLRHVCYDSAPRAEPLWPEHTPRSTLPSHTTHSIFSWQDSLCIHAAAYVRT